MRASRHQLGPLSGLVSLASWEGVKTPAGTTFRFGVFDVLGWRRSRKCGPGRTSRHQQKVVPAGPKGPLFGPLGRCPGSIFQRKTPLFAPPFLKFFPGGTIWKGFAGGHCSPRILNCPHRFLGGADCPPQRRLKGVFSICATAFPPLYCLPPPPPPPLSIC